MTPSPDVSTASPDKVDLREFLWPVEDVGQISASAASAATTALEYHCNRIGEAPTNLSSMFVHYNARLSTGREGSNGGTTMAEALKAITTHGACRDASWPFDAAKFSAKPPASVYDEAKKFAAIRYGNPADVFEALALSYPVPCVVHLPQRSLDEAGRTGVLPTAAAAELPSAGTLVSHALLLVGYDKTAKTFTARNCWGKTWGNQGHCAIPFDLLKVIAPYGAGRLWMILPATVTATDAPAVQPTAAPSAPAAQPERLSDLAARMRQEIRRDLERDIADANKRMKDRK